VYGGTPFTDCGLDLGWDYPGAAQRTVYPAGDCYHQCCQSTPSSCASSPCQNGATCTSSSATQFTCACLTPYTDTTCSTYGITIPSILPSGFRRVVLSFAQALSSVLSIRNFLSSVLTTLETNYNCDAARLSVGAIQSGTVETLSETERVQQAKSVLHLLFTTNAETTGFRVSIDISPPIANSTDQVAASIIAAAILAQPPSSLGGVLLASGQPVLECAGSSASYCSGETGSSGSTAGGGQTSFLDYPWAIPAIIGVCSLVVVIAVPATIAWYCRRTARK